MTGPDEPDRYYKQPGSNSICNNSTIPTNPTSLRVCWLTLIDTTKPHPLINNKPSQYISNTPALTWYQITLSYQQWVNCPHLIFQINSNLSLSTYTQHYEQPGHPLSPSADKGGRFSADKRKEMTSWEPNSESSNKWINQAKSDFNDVINDRTQRNSSHTST